MATTSNLAKRHIEEIRRIKFSIGRKELNPLTLDLNQAVTNLAAELYTKDVHFLMELIQVPLSSVFLFLSLSIYNCVIFFISERRR